MLVKISCHYLFNAYNRANTNWDKKAANYEGKKLLYFIDGNLTTQGAVEPTRRESILDLLLIINNELINNLNFVKILSMVIIV